MVRVFACAALFARVVLAQTSEIHASAPNTIPEMRTRFTRGNYELKNATLVDLIRTAWSVDADKVVGGPDWLDTDRFDVTLTAPAGSTLEGRNAMLRGLLADRFQLVAHEDTRSVPAYVITVGRKHQLKEADGSEESGCKLQPRTAPAGPVVLDCRNITIAAFAKALIDVREASGYVFNYPVVDRTGLKGAWNFNLTWSPRLSLRANPIAGETTTIFDAFEKQLGLKLELTKIPTPVVVVDSAKKPDVTKEPPTPQEFEVAEIKPDDPDRQGAYVRIQPGGEVRIVMTLRDLISEAWGAMDRHRIVGGPKSLDTTRWAVIAKAPAQEDAVAGWNGPVWNGVDIDSMRMMLRALLVDRFKLVAHTENRLISGYQLVAIGKTKLRKADPSNRPGCKEGPGADGKDPRIQNPIASRLITCRNMTLAQFAAEMNKMFVELPPVVDATGITGRYDMTINFSPQAALQNIVEPGAGADAVASEPTGAISFSEALNSQLGLKLESRKVMAPVLVIDHVNETPTEN